MRRNVKIKMFKKQTAFLTCLRSYIHVHKVHIDKRIYQLYLNMVIVETNLMKCYLTKGGGREGEGGQRQRRQASHSIGTSSYYFHQNFNISNEWNDLLDINHFGSHDNLRGTLYPSSLSSGAILYFSYINLHDIQRLFGKIHY